MELVVELKERLYRKDKAIREILIKGVPIHQYPEEDIVREVREISPVARVDVDRSLYEMSRIVENDPDVRDKMEASKSEKFAVSRSVNSSLSRLRSDIETEENNKAKLREIEVKTKELLKTMNDGKIKNTIIIDERGIQTEEHEER